MRFETQLELHPLPNRHWELTEDLIADTETVGRITVPKGFITDLSSIPRFLWWESTPSDYPRRASSTTTATTTIACRAMWPTSCIERS
jgi:hypothetical protein